MADQYHCYVGTRLPCVFHDTGKILESIDYTNPLHRLMDAFSFAETIEQQTTQRKRVRAGSDTLVVVGLFESFAPRQKSDRALAVLNAATHRLEHLKVEVGAEILLRIERRLRQNYGIATYRGDRP